MGNGPTEEDAEIIQHDQLSTHSEDAEEVRASGAGFLSFHFGSALVSVPKWLHSGLLLKKMKMLILMISLPSGPLRAPQPFPRGPPNSRWCWQSPQQFFLLFHFLNSEFHTDLNH